MNAFELLNKPGLWLLGGLAPLVLLYILKIKRERVRVPSTWLWQSAKRDLMAKHPFRRLIAELPLILQILALIALAVALARPADRGGRIHGDHVAIIVDTSASMGTSVKTGGTRMEQAKKSAADVAGALSPGADAMVIEAGRAARVASPLERDTKHLRAAIAQLEVREVEGDLSGAVALAADRLRSLGGAARIVVVTDGALAHAGKGDGPVELAAAGIPTEIVTVGDAEDNTAIVRIDVRSGIDPSTKREQAQAFVMLESYSAKPRDAYVTLTVQGQRAPVASRRVLVPPGEKLPVVLTFDPRPEDRGAGLIAQIDHDALPLDDVAYARVPAGQEMPVTLASRGSYSWVARALDADPQVSLQRVTLEQLGTVNVDPDALVVVEGACPSELPGHDLLVLAPPEGRCQGIDVGAVTEQPILTSWEAGDPRLRFLTLDGVHVARGRAISAPGATGSLLRAGKVTLMADATVPGRAGTIVGFDVGDSDWPLKASFVLFVRNVVEQARVHRAQGAASPVRTGDPLRVAVPAGVTAVKVEGPQMPDHELPVKGGFAIVPAVEHAGIYRVRWTSPHLGAVVIPANLTSELESDIRPRAVAVAAVPEAGATPGAAVSRAPIAHREWAPWLALFAVLVLAFDVAWLARRTGPRKERERTPSGLAIGLGAAILGLAPLGYEFLVRLGLLRETYLRFGNPVAVLACAVAGLWLGRSLSALPGRMTTVRRTLVVVLSQVAVFSAALAVAEPELGRPLNRMTVVLAIDRSRSIDLVPGADSRVRSEVRLAERGMRDDDRVGTVAFGADAVTEDPPRPRSDLPPPQRIEVGRDGTDLEAAIRRSLAELPPDTTGRVVLMTDGVQTRGDALSAAAAAVAADVPIDVVLLEQKTFPDVRVVTVRAPSRADEGETVDLRVVTSSAVATDVEVRIKRDGELLHTARGHVEAGEDVLRIRENANAPGLHRYDVEVSALDPSADGAPDDNAGSAFVRVRGPSLALVLEGDPGKGAPLRRALEGSGFITNELTTTAVPADIGGLAGYDLVVLSDVRASDLTTTQIDALASYARDLGGGLVLMGGDRSMGPGGYARTPIEEVSPVGFDLKQEKRRASLAEVIAIDYSGSMAATVGKQTKLALANEAAARSATLLGPGDRLGVEHVDTVVSWTVPLSPVTNSDAIAKSIRAVSVGGGGIYTDIALRAGYEALEKEAVNLKHVLLFADGADAEQLAGCRALVGEAARKGMTTSVISLGRGSDTPELEVLSRLGGGRFYLIDDATKLPAVFTQETILATRGAIAEKPFRVALGAPGSPTRSVDFSGAPELKGYVITVPKPRATVLLSGPEGDPILSSWAVGIGRSAAFTSDYKDRWGSAWLAWPEGVKLMGQLARDTARNADDPRVRLEADAESGVLHVRADVVGDDGRAQTFRRLTVHVAGPDGIARDVSLDAVGAGRYAANVPLARPGTYVATVKDELTGSAVGTTGAVLSAGEELRPTGSDRVLLSRIAQMTGGKMRDTLAGIFDDRASRRFAYSALGPALVLAAALAMLFAVAARRLAAPAFLGQLRARMILNAEEAARHRRERIEESARGQVRANEQMATNAALLERRRSAKTAPPTSQLLGDLQNPGRPIVPPPNPSAPGPPPVQQGPPPAENAQKPAAPTLSAAERLAQKRRERNR